MLYLMQNGFDLKSRLIVFNLFILGIMMNHFGSTQFRPVDPRQLNINS